MTTPDLWLAAFAGGAFGAAIGAFPALTFTGLLVIAGEVADFTGSGMAANVTSQVALGPVFGPHVSFAGGVAAAAYAARRGYMDFGFDYHEAKNVTAALGTKPDVLLVGGVFGLVGMGIGQVSFTLGLPLDPISLGVVLSALVARLAFGYPLIGEVRGDGLFDMSPFERGQVRTPAPGDRGEGGATPTDGGTADRRLAVEPWLPQQYRWPGVAAIGLVAGILGAYCYVVTGSWFLGYGISAASLLFLVLGVEEFPVTHHVTLVASTATAAAMASGGGVIAGLGPTGGVVVGGLFGILAALFAEAFQRVFYAHADTHWDPPAAAIVIGTLLIAVLSLVGVFPSAEWIPLP